MTCSRSLTLLLFLSTLAFAQPSTLRIAVLDPRGVAIAGARVELIQHSGSIVAVANTAAEVTVSQFTITSTERAARASHRAAGQDCGLPCRAWKTVDAAAALIASWLWLKRALPRPTWPLNSRTSDAAINATRAT